MPKLNYIIISKNIFLINVTNQLYTSAKVFLTDASMALDSNIP